tara:strand:- start:50 stop:256 length:207 start_codon:yes stop_codon:yes gene_type:complete
MATSDELLEALEKIQIDYDSSPLNDELPYKPNWHVEIIKILQAIEYNQRIFNEMYRIKHGVTITTAGS